MGLFSAKGLLLIYEAQKLPSNRKEFMKFILEGYWFLELLQFFLALFAILTLALMWGQQILLWITWIYYLRAQGISPGEQPKGVGVGTVSSNNYCGPWRFASPYILYTQAFVSIHPCAFCILMFKSENLVTMSLDLLRTWPVPYISSSLTGRSLFGQVRQRHKGLL